MAICFWLTKLNSRTNFNLFKLNGHRTATFKVRNKSAVGDIRYKASSISITSFNSWDDVYEEELANFEELGDEGEIWCVLDIGSCHLLLLNKFG